ncbi:FAD-binding oxidoreductase [Salinirubrum litoreum]|uniref:FAD-binding oxidoreductase n=1 Tax=Salinirubrum litoreum TaxID=1126234 RepID=A0ABD5RAK2_9EURY|nr:FAD-binding oxidoreductase [Salinirubrum litoreum]
MASTFTTPFEQSVVGDLRAKVHGEVILPDDETYHEARALWNGRIDRFPAAIVRVASPEDVRTVLRFAREQNREIAVRGGGHHVTGSALVDDGVVIDLSNLTDVAVDPDAKTVRVGAGARVSDVLSATQEHGLAIVCGSAAHNGIAGSTLAGAIGWLRRARGLGIDGLRSVELVTVDGDIVTVSADEHPDLFWGVRGGGANVGVVTSFEFDAFDLGPEVAVAQVAFPAPDAATTADLYRKYREYVADAPDEVTSMAITTAVPPLPFVPVEQHGAPIVMYYAVYAGDPAEGEEILRPLREVGEPAMDMSATMPLLALHEVATELFPTGNRYSWHSLYATELSDDLIDRIAEGGVTSPGPEAGLTLWHMGGAVGDVAGDETAYGWREAEYLVSIDAGWRDPADDEAHLSWAESVWHDLRESPATIEGFYPGFPGFVTGEERARMAYGENYDRLAELKAEYDPQNLLHSNLNVEPAR